MSITISSPLMMLLVPVILEIWQRVCMSVVGRFGFSDPIDLAGQASSLFPARRLKMGSPITEYGGRIGPKIAPSAVLAMPCGWPSVGLFGPFGNHPLQML